VEPLRASTHELTVADGVDHLRITLTGYADFYSAPAVATAIADALRRFGRSRALIDQRALAGGMSAAQAHWHGNDLPLWGARPHERVALLDTPEQAPMCELMARAAAERGLHQIRYFTDEAAALAWLRAAPVEFPSS
jgi:hypothetical protein